MKITEQTVQSTMLIALYGRAQASKQFPDILTDTEAEEIVKNLNYDFTLIDKTYGTQYGSLCCLVRAKRLEERCQEYIADHPDGAVVNLGAGLDTTFSRVDNGRVRWYNIDLPDSIAFRQSLIPPKERVINIPKSMFDYSWFDQIETVDGSVFILAGGLFYYFHEKEIHELIDRITVHFDHGEVFFDAQSKRAMKISNRMVRRSGNKASEMHFYVNDLQALKRWSSKINKVLKLPFFGKHRKHKKYNFSTKVMIWGMEAFRMGFMISIQFS